MIKVIAVLCLFAIAFAHPKVKKISEEQFQETLSRKLPNNGLINGGNKERGMEAMMRAKKYVSTNGCNTNVCFTLDTGVFVSQEEYSMQQDFVALVASVAGIDERFSVAGVQYGLKTTPISSLTEDVDQFLEDLDSSTTPGPWTRYQRRAYRSWWWRWRSRRSFKRSLKFCIRELKEGEGGVNKIFILGDLRSPRAGAWIARRFLPPFGNGAICAVGFGDGSPEKLARFTGSEDRVLTLDQVDEALDILEDVVKEVCGPSNPPQPAESGVEQKAYKRSW